MAIAFIGTGGAAASSHASPSVSEGRILIVSATNRLTQTIPTKPGDFTSIISQSCNGNLDCAAHMGYKVAGVGGFTGTGTWTDADMVCWAIYSGQRIANPIGLTAERVNTTNVTFVRFPARTLSPNRTGQWMLFGCVRPENSAILDNGMTGATQRTAVAIGGSGTDYCATYLDTNGIRATDWPETDISGTAGVSGEHLTFTVELLAEGGDVSSITPKVYSYRRRRVA